jgi:hypothetical protein
LGLLAPLSLLAFVILEVGTNTLFASQGIQGHARTLLDLMAVTVFVAHTYHAVSRRSWKSLLWAGSESTQTSLRAGRCVLAATYVVAGLSKLGLGGWDWWLRGECFVIQVCKAQDEMIFTTAHPLLSECAKSGARLLENYPDVATPILAMAHLLELGAFLACTTRWRALLLGLGLLCFHKSNDWLMGLPFNTNLDFVLIFFIMPFYWAKRLIELVLPPFRKVAGGAASTSIVPAPLRNWLTPAAGSILFAIFLYYRGEWHPFSNFPMYSVLPPSTVSIYATDMNGNIIPFEQLRLTAPTVKKMISVELRKYKADGTVRRMSHLTQDHWREATKKVVTHMRETWDNPRIRDTSFELHCKSYEAGDRVTITSMSIGEFPAVVGNDGAKS